MCVYILPYPFTIDGHLGYFFILAIVNNTVVNIGVHISFWNSVLILFKKIPKNGIARFFGSSINFFWGNSILFSTVVASIYILTTIYEGSCFSTFSLTLVISWLFSNSIPRSVKWHLTVVLICIRNSRVFFKKKKTKPHSPSLMQAPVRKLHLHSKDRSSGHSGTKTMR